MIIAIIRGHSPDLDLLIVNTLFANSYIADHGDSEFTVVIYQALPVYYINAYNRTRRPRSRPRLKG